MVKWFALPAAERKSKSPAKLKPAASQALEEIQGAIESEIQCDGKVSQQTQTRQIELLMGLERRGYPLLASTTQAHLEKIRIRASQKD